ncbi:MAG TPA: heavy-metal-associated domain-containing protein [candidate division Zixibacteria bacterium]|nr:heavy-metal-associated domain-containing protein [candidate division Zixibacteria bacterium]
MTEEHIKSRVISVHNFTRHKCQTHGIPVLLKKIPGIISARIDDKKGKLFVTYDLDQTTYADIGDVLRAVGCMPDDTLGQHLRESFIRFAEENERAHIASHSRAFSYSPMEELDELLEED